MAPNNQNWLFYNAALQKVFTAEVEYYSVHPENASQS